MVTGSLTEGFKITGRISRSHKLVGKISARKTVTGKIGVNVVPYSGEHVVTPTKETQTLATHGLKMISDVTINPIPNNYARMSWDGTILHFY